MTKTPLLTKKATTLSIDIYKINFNYANINKYKIELLLEKICSKYQVTNELPNPVYLLKTWRNIQNSGGACPTWGAQRATFF